MFKQTSGAYDIAETKAKVYIKLTNEDGDSTEFVKLSNRFDNASVETFNLELKDIGTPAIIHFSK